MTIRCAAVALTAVFFTSGCASVMEGTTQVITVDTTPEGGAACVASNDQGQWPLVTPGSVTVAKSNSVLMIRCTKSGFRDGVAYAAGRMSSASMIGNMMPYVGILNAAVDGSSGAALQYPSSYVIAMKPLVSTSAPAPAPAAAAPPATPAN